MNFLSDLGFAHSEKELRHDAAPKTSWKEIAARLTEEFVSWGCRFDRKLLPELAMTYDCTPLFFWNWLDGEEDISEKGFLRVLGYAWRKHMEEEAEPAPRCTAGEVPADAAEKRIAA